MQNLRKETLDSPACEVNITILTKVNRMAKRKMRKIEKRGVITL